MECKHEIQNLMGTADGIVCRACGRIFANINEIMAANTPVEKKPAKPAKKAAKKEAKTE